MRIEQAGEHTGIFLAKQFIYLIKIKYNMFNSYYAHKCDNSPHRSACH